MKILIMIDRETGEVWYYVPNPKGTTVLIEPRKEKKEDGEEEDDKRVIH